MKIKTSELIAPALDWCEAHQNQSWHASGVYLRDGHDVGDPFLRWYFKLWGDPVIEISSWIE